MIKYEIQLKSSKGIKPKPVLKKLPAEFPSSRKEGKGIKKVWRVFTSSRNYKPVEVLICKGLEVILNKLMDKIAQMVEENEVTVSVVKEAIEKVKEFNTIIQTEDYKAIFTEQLKGFQSKSYYTNYIELNNRKTDQTETNKKPCIDTEEIEQSDNIKQDNKCKDNLDKSNKDHEGVCQSKRGNDNVFQNNKEGIDGIDKNKEKKSEGEGKKRIIDIETKLRMMKEKKIAKIKEYLAKLEKAKMNALENEIQKMRERILVRKRKIKNTKQSNRKIPKTQLTDIFKLIYL